MKIVFNNKSIILKIKIRKNIIWEIIMRKLISITIAIIIVLTFVGCSQKNNIMQTTYNVIKTINEDGNIYNFEYNSAKNCVTVSVNDGSNTDLLIFVNSDGAITSIYQIESGRQTIWFEENSEDYPITIYNDAGGVKSVEYDNLLKFIFTYDNYADNKLTTITYYKWDSFYGWDEDNAGTRNISDYELPEGAINYISTTNSNFKMFNSVMWLYTMMDVLEAVYD